MLDGGKDSLNYYKICHNYSIFSLYEINKDMCCNFNTPYFKDVLKPDSSSNYSNICNTGACSAIAKMDCTENCTPKEYKVRFYNLSNLTTLACGIPENNFYPHSARVDNGLCWHKFNGYDFLIAIETDNIKLQDFNYCLAKEINLVSYPVPTTMFKDGVEKDEVFDITV
jgi:hypothetical protein